MESFIIHWGYAAVFLFGFLEACCVPIPSEITFGFAGVLAGEAKLNVVAIIIIGTIAELLGSLVSYGIGRVGERPLVARFGRYLLITESDIDRAERFLAGRGAWAIPVGRALPVVRTFISIVAGFVKVPLMMFALLSLLGTAVWVTAITLIGYAVGTQWQKVAHGFALAGYVIVVVAVIGIAVFVWHRIREVRREQAAGTEAVGTEAAGTEAVGTEAAGPEAAGPEAAGPAGRRGAHQPKHRSPTA